jgi:hypothetical protein
VAVPLHDRGLIAMGYGGHEASIKAILGGLRSRNVVWVTAGGDFDTLLLLLCDASPWNSRRARPPTICMAVTVQVVPTCAR